MYVCVHHMLLRILTLPCTSKRMLCENKKVNICIYLNILLLYIYYKGQISRILFGVWEKFWLCMNKTHEHFKNTLPHTQFFYLDNKKVMPVFQCKCVYVRFLFSPRLTSVIKQPPDVHCALPLFLLKLLAGLQQPLVRHIQRHCWTPLVYRDSYRTHEPQQQPTEKHSIRLQDKNYC